MNFRLEILSEYKRAIYAEISAEQVNNTLKQEEQTLSENEQKSKEIIVEKVFAAALNQYRLYPVGPVTVEPFSLQRGHSATLKISFEILPDIPLPQKLDTLSVDMEEAIVHPGEFHAFLHNFLRSKGRLTPINEDRLPQNGDIVELEVDTFQEGQPQEIQHQKLQLQLQEKSLYPELNTAVRSLHTGESCSGYLNKESGIRFTVQLTSIKKEILPKLDDSLAISCGRKDLKTLYEDLYKSSLSRKMSLCRKRAEQDLLGRLLAEASFPIPESLLKTHNRFALLEKRQQAQSARPDADKHEKKTCSEQAMVQARTQAFLMALGYREGLTVSEEDISSALLKLAQHNQNEADTLRLKISRSGLMYELQDRILAEKALHLLYTKAKKNVIDVHGHSVHSPIK